MTKPARASEWERILAAEGLGSLDYAAGDDIIVSNRGAAKDWQHDGDLEAAASEMDRRRAIKPRRLRRNTTALERRIWRLHAEGVGYQAIARRLRIGPHSTRVAIAKVEELEAQRVKRVAACRSFRQVVATCDTWILVRLLRAIGG